MAGRPKFRYGFKAECERHARRLRGELSLRPHDPLDLDVLADHLGVTLMPLSALAADIPDACRVLRGPEQAAFSAVTIVAGADRLVVHNDSHPLRRRRSNIAHELSHAILEHPATPPLNDAGCRYFDMGIEDEEVEGEL